MILAAALYCNEKVWKPTSNLVAKAEVRETAVVPPTLNLVSNYSMSSAINLV